MASLSGFCKFTGLKRSRTSRPMENGGSNRRDHGIACWYLGDLKLTSQGGSGTRGTEASLPYKMFTPSKQQKGGETANVFFFPRRECSGALKWSGGTQTSLQPTNCFLCGKEQSVFSCDKRDMGPARTQALSLETKRGFSGKSQPSYADPSIFYRRHGLRTRCAWQLRSCTNPSISPSFCNVNTPLL